MRRDWASLGGGGSIADFTGPDYTDFGCGPTAAIDQSQASGWGSTTDNDAGDGTGLVTPKFIVVKLPAAVNVSQIAVDPSNTCGDPGSSSTRGYRIETSADGTNFTELTAGVFYLANRGQMNTVFSGSLAGVRYVKFWMLNPQVPTDPDPTLTALVWPTAAMTPMTTRGCRRIAVTVQTMASPGASSWTCPRSRSSDGRASRRDRY